MTAPTVTPNGTRPTHAEAPASATVRATDPTGYEWLLTVRAETVADLLTRAGVVSSWLDEHGWKTSRSSTPGSNGTAPTCPEHGKPMRPGKRGGWFCPVEVGRHPQTGTALYCQHKA